MKIVYVLGNGKSLSEVKLQKLANKITIGCNYIFKSGFTPTYYCLTDVNFFNHCTFDVFTLDTTFVLAKPFYEKYKDRVKGKVMVVEFNRIPFLETKDFDYKRVSSTCGTLTNFAFPLAVHLLGDRGDREIRVLGIDHTEERLHFYSECDDSLKTWLLVALDTSVKESDMSHSPFIKDKIAKEFEHTRKLVEKRGIGIYNCSGDTSKLIGIKRKQISWLTLNTKNVDSKES